MKKEYIMNTKSLSAFINYAYNHSLPANIKAGTVDCNGLRKTNVVLEFEEEDFSMIDGAINKIINSHNPSYIL